jgi:hypothetical protein
MWCTILNAGILALWISVFAALPDFTYRLQTKFFPMSRDAFNIVIYCAYALYRLVFIVFVFIPFVALLIAA